MGGGEAVLTVAATGHPNNCLPTHGFVAMVVAATSPPLIVCPVPMCLLNPCVSSAPVYATGGGDAAGSTAPVHRHRDDSPLLHSSAICNARCGTGTVFPTPYIDDPRRHPSRAPLTATAAPASTRHSGEQVA